VPLELRIEGCLLHRTLGIMAARFTPHGALRAKFVDEAVTEVLRNLCERDDDFDIDMELLAAMRRVALREFGLLSDEEKGCPGRGATQRQDASMKS